MLATEERPHGLTYGTPDAGSGAQAYIEELITGLSDEDALTTILRSRAGELHNEVDTRVQRCAHCGFYWRNTSSRSDKLTCSAECNTGRKTLQRGKQREKAALINPSPPEEKRTLADDYTYWNDYPFWIDEYSMLKRSWKKEVSHKPETIDFVYRQQCIYGEHNRKVEAKAIDY